MRSKSNRQCCFFVSFFAGMAGLFLPATRLHATAISVDPGPAPTVAAQLTASFGNVDGTMLQGQSIGLDFTWGAGKFIRLFTVTDSSFATLLTFQTSGSGLVGFLQGTGYLVDQNGHALGGSLDLGSASGNDGSLTVGMFPLISGAVSRPLDFFGLHFDLQLPSDRSISITGGQLELTTSGGRPTDKFGVGPGVPADIVPDSGFTAVLLGLGFAPLLGLKRWVPRRSW